MGVATLAGVGMMILLIPVNAVIAAKSRKLQVHNSYVYVKIITMNRVV